MLEGLPPSSSIMEVNFALPLPSVSTYCVYDLRLPGFLMFRPCSTLRFPASTVTSYKKA